VDTLHLPVTDQPRRAAADGPSCSCNTGGLDVLVEPEDVVRIVGSLDVGQALIIDTVGVPDAVAALLTKVVDIYAPAI
jgi:hypothetical protein